MDEWLMLWIIYVPFYLELIASDQDGGGGQDGTGQDSRRDAGGGRGGDRWMSMARFLQILEIN